DSPSHSHRIRGPTSHDRGGMPRGTGEGIRMWSRSSRCISALVLLLGIAPLRIDASPIPARESRPLRVEILIDPEALPASDRERSRDRIEAIREALASGLPLLRSFDPREVLEEALGELAALGADVGENAIVN